MRRRRQANELTPRQRQVLEFVRRGLTNEEIALRLDISLAGVKYHVSQILARLGVADRDGAASASLERRSRWAGWPLWAPVAIGATAVVAAATIAFAAIAMHSGQEEEAFTLAGGPEADAGALGGVEQADACDWARYDGPHEAGWDVLLGCGVDFLFPSTHGDSCLWEAIKDDAVAASWLAAGRGCGWRGNTALSNDSGVCSPRVECSRLLPPREAFD